MQHFGEKLRRLRGDTPQKAVAGALDIPQTTLSSLEKQKTIPRGDILKRLADFFAVPVEYFYDVPPVQPSEPAKTWLRQLRTDMKGRDTVATHSGVPLDAETREKIAQKIRKKYAENPNKNR